MAAALTCARDRAVLDAALIYAARGWRVFPVHSMAGAACSCGATRCASPGKHPRTIDGLKSATTDTNQIEAWWAKWPDANVAIATGETAKAGEFLVVLDEDPRHAGDESRVALEMENGELPDTPRVLTGGGGIHYFFTSTRSEPSSTKRVGEGLDVRGVGGYVVAAPSNHESGGRYRWDVGAAETLAEWPAWLRVLNSKERSTSNCQATDGGAILSGSRDDTLTSIAGAMRRKGMSAEEILPSLRALNERRCKPPLPSRDIDRIASSVARYEPAETMHGEARLAPRLADALTASIVRAERRASGREKPITLPWLVLADHFGGGLWPGLHIINKGTGVGGTQLALQVALGATKRDVPTLYVGLELGGLDLALRLLGEEAHVPWSSLWIGKAGPEHLRRVRAAARALESLPFHYEVARPMGFAASALLASVESLRAEYPETDGPGSRPLLVVVDFLQLVGDELGNEQEIRARVGRASYVLRDVANRLNVAVLCISSVARERYKTLADIHAIAGLAYEPDADGCPVNRRILDTDAIVGTGKESGELEYSADSVSVLARVPATWAGTGCDVIFATAKGRATGATWSPLHFTGFRYEDTTDRGGRIVQAWTDAAERRARAKQERQAAKEQAKVDGVSADAEAVRAYVASHPGCSVREARLRAVKDSARRWNAAVAALGAALEPRKQDKRVALFLRGGSDASL